MSKALINDMVAVVKVNQQVKKANEEDNGRYIAYTGKLIAQDRGRPTEDKRAYGEEGDCPGEMEVVAKGWSIIQTDEGKRVSVPSRDVMIHSQKIVRESAYTLAKATELAATRATQEAALQPARDFAVENGLDVTTLTDHNLKTLFEKFGS